MNFHSKSAWVRAAGLVAVLGLGACDSGAEAKADAKKTEPVKAVEPVKTEPVKAPEPAKVEPAPEVKPDVPATPDANAADPVADPAGDAKVPDAKPAETKPEKKPEAKTDKKPAEPKVAAIDGKPIYDAKCKSCHAADGKGTEAMKKKNVPDLTDAGWQGKHNKQKIVDVLNAGIAGTVMKSFKDKLKPEEIDAVAVYVKKLK